MSSVFEDFFGSTLLSPGDRVETPTNTVIGDSEYVAIYFSAHWCPPCRNFTPMLAKYYNMMKEKGTKFQIVFASSDKDEESYKEYISEMPWACLPFSASETKKKLSKKYKVTGIPTLVIVDKEGKTITDGAVGKVRSDPEGKDFPYKPLAFHEILTDDVAIHKKDGTASTWGALKSKTAVGLYFSAHWCGPCRAFTPSLSQTYEAIQKKHPDQFEIVFISSDQDDAQFQEYLGEMPWYALPFEKRNLKALLSDHFGVRGIPNLIILNPQTGDIINPSGRSAVSQDPEGNSFPWHPLPVGDLSKGPDGINDFPSLVVFTSSLQKEKQESLYAELSEIAKVSKEKKEEILFFITYEEAGITERVRKLTSFDKTDKGQVLLLDIPDDGGFYVLEDSVEVNKQSIAQFLDDYRAKKLTRKQLS